MPIKNLIVKYQRELLALGAGILVVILFCLIFCYLPRPKLTNPPTSTKEAVVHLQGTAAKHVGIAIFDKAGNALVIVNTNDKGEFSLDGVPVGEGSNVYTLRALNGKWRASWPLKITIVKDTVAPALSMNELNGATVTGSGAVVSGKAEPGSSVMVNGVKTTVAADGTWTATVALAPGKNTVTVASTDPAGNTTTQSQTITYSPTASGSQTGTATVTASSTQTSAGSAPAPTATTTGTTSGTTTGSTGSATTSSGTTSPAPTTTPTTPPASQPVLAIIATTWVSNASPNARANETIFATVKDNYGRAVTDASVIAIVSYKNGTQAYSLTSQGNGTYSVSFKLNGNYESDYRIGVNVTARYNGFTSSAATSFTPL